MKSNFLEVLIDLKSNKKFTQRKIAEKLGVSEDHISRIVNGKDTASDQLLRSIQMLHQIEFDESAKSNIETAEKPNAVILPKPIDISRKVPIVSYAQAGPGIQFDDVCNQMVEWVETETRDRNAFALIIEGDSMTPEVCPGDRIVFAPNESPRNGNLVVAKLLTGEVYFKRFRRTGKEGQTIVLESANPDYSPMQFTEDRFEWIFPAIDMKRTFRR